MYIYNIYIYISQQSFMVLCLHLKIEYMHYIKTLSMLALNFKLEVYQF